jgi:hypothetical protein
MMVRLLCLVLIAYTAARRGSGDTETSQRHGQPPGGQPGKGSCAYHLSCIQTARGKPCSNICFPSAVPMRTIRSTSALEGHAVLSDVFNI